MTNLDCTLNGVSLSGIYERICILDIIEDAPRMHETTLALHTGVQRVLARERQSISIRVRFAIHEERPAMRCFILQQIHDWAQQNGYLTLTARPGQQLHVRCTGLPNLSGNDWTEELTLVFTSTHTPWWEDAETTSASGTDAVHLTVPGNADSTPVEVALINTTAATVTQVTVICGVNHITFRDIALPSGGQLVISRVNGAFIAKLDGSSILHHRTMDSADELLAPCGQTATLYVSPSQGMYAFYNVRGRYL
jgi:hypothetical protein